MTERPFITCPKCDTHRRHDIKQCPKCASLQYILDRRNRQLQEVMEVSVYLDRRSTIFFLLARIPIDEVDKLIMDLKRDVPVPGFLGNLK